MRMRKKVVTLTMGAILAASPLAYSSTVSSVASGSNTLEQIHTAKTNYWFKGSRITVKFDKQSGTGWSNLSTKTVSN